MIGVRFPGIGLSGTGIAEEEIGVGEDAEEGHGRAVEGGRSGITVVSALEISGAGASSMRWGGRERKLVEDTGGR